jgi:hypothetical protein
MQVDQDIMINKFREVWTLLKSESIRGSVIVAAAIHDDMLRQILSKRFIPCESKSDYLFDGANAPIGNMAARIDIAYRTACISTKMRDSLHIVRKLRNEFAHLSKPINFEDQSVQDRSEYLFKLNRPFVELIWPCIRPEVYKFAGVTNPPVMDGDVLADMLIHAGYRHIFEILASAVAGSLAEKCDEIETLKEHGSGHA